MKYLLPACAVLLFLGCAGKERVEPAAAETTTTAQTETQPVATASVPAQPPQQTATLPANAPIPGTGVLLWLSADDAVSRAQDGKVKTWQNALVPGMSANAANPDRAPAFVTNALNGHAVVRFNGTDQMLMSNVDISPARMPEGTIVTVFTSATAESSPLRKIYGDDNGGFDRAAGLDDRAPGNNFTLFIGSGVAGYFQLEPNKVYVTVDEYSPKKFSGWVNGVATLKDIDADWQEDALPNLYIGGTGAVFSEYWQGDLAEIIVYARKLSADERTRVENYLVEKYRVAR